ncbi:MAG: hypothetical protein ABEK12_04060 [Candidatus Nanohaloarchaea archaeon]
MIRRLISLLGTDRVARLDERIRPALIAHLPPRLAIRLYSAPRDAYLAALKHEPVDDPVTPPASCSREFWGVAFQAPIMNAAGLFKAGAAGYDLAADQGAGAYLAGTFTPRPRRGNTVQGVTKPFVPLPRSDASVNSMGLPNPGFATRDAMGYDRSAQANIAAIDRRQGVPVGASVMGTPGNTGTPDYADEVVDGLAAMADAGADFAEINESCPNTERTLPQETGLGDRLAAVADKFLATSDLPVVVKFSVDTPVEQVPEIVDLLLDHGFHGVNFGNTSTAYDDHRKRIDAAERDAYDTFTAEIGGGVGGRPIADRSLALSTAAADRVEERDPDRDFMVVRTGGIEDTDDVDTSLDRGIGMTQWYTGYWKMFAAHGHDVYRALLSGLDGTGGGAS